MEFSNHIPDPRSPLFYPLELRFNTATDYISKVGLSDMAQYKQDGTEEAAPVFPWKLRFVPGDGLRFPDTMQPGQTGDFTDQLASIATGTMLYDVYALDMPEELGGTEKHIAQMVTKSQLSKSNFGDEKLFFRH